MGEILETVDQEELAVLVDERCREALTHLGGRSDGATSLAALASDCGDDAVGGRADPAVRLHHVTLPKLDDVGLVDYDADGRTVRYLAGEDTERWLDRIEDRR